MKAAPTDPARRPRRRAPRRKTLSYSVPMKIRMAYLAGQGRSGGEIAEEIGIDDPQRVRSALRNMGIRLLREPGGMELIMVHVARPVRDAMVEIADRAELTPEELAARILTLMCVEERVMLENLLDIGQPE